MRPIKLSFEGIHSFKEAVEIDFEKLTEYGLFGIFGETGSGKSTILDAMILALYDQIPRAMDGGSVKNALNDASNEMKVYYKYALGSDIYEITRIYKKGKSKGEEVINSKDPLMLKNGTIIADKKTKVDFQVKETFGIDIIDFTRSVVLPQGKFTEFLKLKNTEKFIMLEKIFSLEKYGVLLENRIKIEKKESDDEVKKYQNQRIGKGEITPTEIGELQEELSFNNIILEKKLIERSIFLKKFEKSKKIYDLTLQLEKIVEEKKYLESKISENSRDENLLKHLETIKEFQNRLFLIEQEEIITKNEEQNLEKLKISFINEETNRKLLEIEQEKNRSLIEEKRTERNKIEFSREDLKKITEIWIEKRELLKNIESIQILNKKYLDLETSFAKTIANKKNEEKLILELEMEIKKIDYIAPSNLLKLENENILLLELDKKNKTFILEREELIKNKDFEIKKIKNSETKLKEIEKEILFQESEIKKKLSAELSQDLVEGTPCPVCGSEHHPVLAHGSTLKIDITNDLLKQLRYEKENSLEKLGTYKNTVETFNKGINEKELFLNENPQEEIQTKLIYFSSLISDTKIIQENQKKFENELKEKLTIAKNNNIHNDTILKNLLIQIKDGKDSLTNKNELILVSENKIKFLDPLFLEISLEDILLKKKNMEQNELTVDTLTKNIEVLDLRNGKLSVELKNEMEKLKIKNEEISILIGKIEVYKKDSQEKKEILLLDIEKCNLDNIKVIKETLILDKDIIQLKNKIDSFSSKVVRNTSFYEKIISELNGDCLTLQEWNHQQELNIEIEKNYLDLSSKVKLLEKKLDEKKILNKEIENILLLEKKAQNHYDLIVELSKKVGAKKLVRYISEKKLAIIVALASQRLEKISNGRYTLINDELCDFFIVDSFNSGVKRAVSTLSGGEMFIVSLSLALALSNQLQLKGETQLEFFFLDEGFGTLDPNLLDKVMDSLENIRKEEKIKIGIISHVEELKSRLVRKIEVSSAVPGVKGSSIKLL